MSLRAIFFGTPDFALPTLNALHHAPEINLLAVLTQPDRPAGRGKLLQFSPIKKAALEFDVDILQPETLKETPVMDWLRQYSPDVIVVVAYGGFVPKTVRELPRYGCVNLHPSLLPKYRGAAPIHWAILRGEQLTGNTTMYLAGGWDNGDMIYQEAEPILATDTYGALAQRLAEKGALLILRSLIDISAGIAPRIPQTETGVIMAPMIRNEEAHIDWRRTAGEIHNQVRGLNPVPGAFTNVGEERWKILRTEIIPEVPQAPGLIVSTAFNTIRVSAADAVVEILEMQPPGKRAMSAAEYLRGHSIISGTQCG